MTTLVTGCEGFVGTILMKRNPDFLGCDKIKTRDTTIELNLTREDQLLQFCIENKVEEIIHLAGAQYSTKIDRRKRKKYFEEGNVVPAQSIKSVAEKIGLKHLIFLSTDMVYGKSASGNISEDAKMEPYGPYGESKLKAELIMGSLRNPTIVTIFRPRLILGAGRTGTITQLHKWIGTGLPVPIIGSGKNRYQFIAVGDVVSAIHKSLELRTSGVFNLGSDNPPRIEELIPLVIEKIRRKNLLIKLPARSTKTLLTFLDSLNVSPLVPEQFLIADQDFVLNTSKFKNYTGWKPERGDSEMLVEALLALDEIN